MVLCHEDSTIKQSPGSHDEYRLRAICQPSTWAVSPSQLLPSTSTIAIVIITQPPRGGWKTEST